MGTQREHLLLAFLKIQPEVLHRSIVESGHMYGWDEEVSERTISKGLYHRMMRSEFQNRSSEEHDSRYALLREEMKSPYEEAAEKRSVFYLLVRMGQRALHLENEHLISKFSKALAWRNVYHELGQDLFTTAWLAAEDLAYGREPRRIFTWEPILKTDNRSLQAVLQQGIAENHCHLGGTTQLFPLSWACLMTYPESIDQADRKIRQNLHANISHGAMDNVWPLQRRLEWAVYLRQRLFCLLEQESLIDRSESWNHLDEAFSIRGVLQERGRILRQRYGARVPVYTGEEMVLDYALRKKDSQLLVDEQETSLIHANTRLLSGERSFLYRCFRASFDGTFTQQEKTYFYLYLLLKENFRAEMIQVNKETGFYNFKEYQDRKHAAYGTYPLYASEALRLAVLANLETQYICSFEVRLTPDNTADGVWEQMAWRKQILQEQNEKNLPLPLFFVYHFTKRPDSGEWREEGILPRNHRVRENVRRQAVAIGEALERYDLVRTMVRGIDASSLEIGCRPETFAMAYRYLRHLRAFNQGDVLRPNTRGIRLRATYHVGEDFLDISDGLRAIDEAIRFLELRRGDRLGHALALGVDPKKHYDFKGKRAILPKQDCLDDMVWLIYRSLELGVEIPAQLRERLRREAQELLTSIYGDHVTAACRQGTLYQYYCSMALRGDDPEAYRCGSFQVPGSFKKGNEIDTYALSHCSELDAYRRDPVISSYYSVYHFDEEVRRRGSVVKLCHISSDYIQLISDLQHAIGGILERTGIMIECNPSSNFLIGTFKRYDEHPIFRFNSTGLVCKDGSVPAPGHQLSVSINTDDPGVFDTSLEQEYAILAAALERRGDGEESRSYTTTSIYQYLDHVRRMGLEQIFGDEHEMIEFFRS